MKGLLLTIIPALLLSHISYAQQNSSGGVLSFSIGPSLPTGGFANDDAMARSAGFAKMGGNVHFSYSKLLGNKFGFTARLFGQINPLNTSSLEGSFSSAKIGAAGYFWSGSTTSPPPAVSGTVYPNWQFEKGSWKMAGLLVGTFAELPVGKGGKISFIPRMMFGAAMVAMPALNGSSITDTARATVYQDKGTSFGVCYTISGGLKYKLSKNIYLVAESEYFATSEIKWDETKSVVTTVKRSPDNPFFYNFSQSTVVGTAVQKISTVNLSVGIGLNL